MDPNAKAAIDTAAILGIAGALLDILPKIAAGFAIAWYIVLFYGKWKERRK